jgi:hypothetical protein
MDFAHWIMLVQRIGADTRIIDPNWLAAKHRAGVSPAIVAQRILAGTAPRTPIPPPIHGGQVFPAVPNYQINTGMGMCNQCRGTNIVQIQNVDNSAAGQKGTAFLLGLCCLWPLLLAIPFVGNKRVTGYSRQCMTCGNRWPV